MPVQPRLAAAVMLLRDHSRGQSLEVFMVRRVIQSDFMPGVYVFPGGSVSVDDCNAEQTEGVCTPVAATVADPEGRTALGTGTRAAAIRELFEEAGVLLAYRVTRVGADKSAMGTINRPLLTYNDENIDGFNAYRQAFNQRKGSLVAMAQAEQLVLATDHLGYCSHWITPEGMPKRFDTHFFLTIAPEEQQAAYDQLETSEGVWIQPTEALTRYERGEFPLVFATIYQLRDLATFASTQEALASTTTRPVPTTMPIVTMENGKQHVYLPSDPNNVWDVPENMTKP